MRVKELIEVLKQCDQDLSIGTYTSNHWIDQTHYRSHGQINVVERDGSIIIGNIPSEQYLKMNQFGEKVKRYYSI